MGNNVSANTLFHFTKKKESLINILGNFFWPHYSEEAIGKRNDGELIKWYVPMICFCDIPLSQINNHILEYGKYAIGLSKEWGINEGISPILYYHKNSLIFKSITSIKNEIAKFEKEPESNKIINYYIYQRLFLKQYEEPVVCRDKTIPIRRYDEREWRYIPAPEKLFAPTQLVLTEYKFKDKELVKDNCKKLRDEFTLKFSPNDIKYIIVETENEILEMCKSIMDLKGSTYSYDQLLILTTRVISTERIMQDF
jgi:hypothetical protein